MMAARADQALDLRIAGATYRQIAAQLHCSAKTAYFDVQTALGALDAVIAKKAERVRDLEVARLDRLNVALAAGIKAGNPGAIFAAVKIMERRAKLLGLDAPSTAQVDLQVHMTDALLARLDRGRQRTAKP
jgi:hypothetical protein